MLALAAALAAPVARLRAHPMPQSTVLLDFRGRTLGLELQLPADRLEVGFGRSVAGSPLASAVREALAAYIAERVAATSADGRAWRVQVLDVRAGEGPTAGEVVAHVRLTAPDGDPARRLTLHYDVIQRELLTHRALVSLRSDWDAGAMSTSPLMLGETGYGATTLDVERLEPRAFGGFASVLRLGVAHIAEGTDHLLFLLALLLPASLVARGGRWGEYAGARRSLRHLVGIVTAFTVGHSVTLALGSSGIVRAPSGLVEVLIAGSILVSAVHAMRPLFPGREAWVAAGFGLVHGLAFATTIAGFGIDPWHTALTILGFNIGIELMQLAVVVSTVPWLLALARTRAYAPLRVGGAVAASVAALGWIGERAFGLANPVGPWVDGVAAHAPMLVVALAMLALGATARPRGRRPAGAAGAAEENTPGPWFRPMRESTVASVPSPSLERREERREERRARWIPVPAGMTTRDVTRAASSAAPRARSVESVARD